MPELSKSTPSTSAPPPPSGPAVSPPIIRPEDFEEYPAFREVFLLLFPDARANAAMREFGRLLHELVLEFWGHWPPHRTRGIPHGEGVKYAKPAHAVGIGGGGSLGGFSLGALASRRHS